jgi:outer membrane protein assembly factor BamA
MMVQSNILVLAFLSIVCALPAWSQDQNRSDGCDTLSSQSKNAPQLRKRTAVRTPAREMKVARLIFVGIPALPLRVQEQIARSLSERDYDDDRGGLDELLERTRDAWQTQGYFKAETELSGVQTLEENSERRTTAITVKIDAGKQYRLDEIQFRDGTSGPGQLHPGEEPVSPEQLRAFFPIRAGEIFDTHKFQTGTEELRKAYGKKGYINFAAVPAFNIDETNDRITVIVDLDKGKQFRIGKIQVRGASPQPAQERMKDAGLTPGSVFDASLLDNLKLSKTFRPEDDVQRVLDEKQGTVDLTIDLRDCP